MIVDKRILSDEAIEMLVNNEVGDCLDECQPAHDTEKTRLPWVERVNAISINPHMAEIKDIFRMAGELNALQSQATELLATIAELRASKAGLVKVARELLDLRDETPMTYNDAYHFVFKTKAWNKLTDELLKLHGDS